MQDEPGGGGVPRRGTTGSGFSFRCFRASPGSVTAPLSASRGDFQEERRQMGPQQASTAGACPTVGPFWEAAWGHLCEQLLLPRRALGTEPWGLQRPGLCLYRPHTADAPAQDRQLEAGAGRVSGGPRCPEQVQAPVAVRAWLSLALAFSTAGGGHSCSFGLNHAKGPHLPWAAGGCVGSRPQARQNRGPRDPCSGDGRARATCQSCLLGASPLWFHPAAGD